MLSPNLSIHSESGTPVQMATMAAAQPTAPARQTHVRSSANTTLDTSPAALDRRELQWIFVQENNTPKRHRARQVRRSRCNRDTSAKTSSSVRTPLPAFWSSGECKSSGENIRKPMRELFLDRTRLHYRFRRTPETGACGRGT